jgi:hypothetical protein
VNDFGTNDNELNSNNEPASPLSRDGAEKTTIPRKNGKASGNGIERID